MYFLFLQVFCGTSNHLLFKLFASQGRRTLPVIVLNYIVCALFGFWLEGYQITVSLIPLAAVQGLLLFNGIWLMGISTARSGVALTALCARLGLVIPVLAAFLFFAESLSFQRLLGLLLALSALALSIPSKTSGSSGRAGFGKNLPALLLFLNAGAYLTLLSYVKTFVLSAGQYEQYVALSFLFALFFSALLLGGRLIKRAENISYSDLIWGLVLGINNFGAVYFLLRSLADSGLDSSVVFPTVSIGVLLLSTLLARVLFAETLTRRKLLACALGAFAVFFLQV
jgi:drug/metabolite transporter (DMT)-like permease